MSHSKFAAVEVKAELTIHDDGLKILSVPPSRTVGHPTFFVVNPIEPADGCDRAWALTPLRDGRGVRDAAVEVHVGRDGIASCSCPAGEPCEHLGWLQEARLVSPFVQSNRLASVEEKVAEAIHAIWLDAMIHTDDDLSFDPDPEDCISAWHLPGDDEPPIHPDDRAWASRVLNYGGCRPQEMSDFERDLELQYQREVEYRRAEQEAMEQEYGF